MTSVGSHLRDLVCALLEVCEKRGDTQRAPGDVNSKKQKMLWDFPCFLPPCPYSTPAAGGPRAGERAAVPSW